MAMCMAQNRTSQTVEPTRTPWGTLHTGLDQGGSWCRLQVGLALLAAAGMRA